jgi:hypothetical protein
LDFGGCQISLENRVKYLVDHNLGYQEIQEWNWFFRRTAAFREAVDRDQFSLAHLVSAKRPDPSTHSGFPL